MAERAGTMLPESGCVCPVDDGKVVDIDHEDRRFDHVGQLGAMLCQECFEVGYGLCGLAGYSPVHQRPVPQSDLARDDQPGASHDNRGIVGNGTGTHGETLMDRHSWTGTHGQAPAPGVTATPDPCLRSVV